MQAGESINGWMCIDWDVLQQCRWRLDVENVRKSRLDTLGFTPSSWALQVGTVIEALLNGVALTVFSCELKPIHVPRLVCP